MKAEHVRSLLDYDPETGVFIWRERSEDLFRTKNAWGAWNTRYAGKQAGTCDSNGYIVITVNGRRYKAHRLAWLYVYDVLPKKGIDHIDENPRNNRIANLREANCSENQRNRGAQRNNSSGYKGVSRTCDGRWRAFINHHRKKIYLGQFDTPEKAHAAYCAAAKDLHGEYANTGAAA